MKQKNKVILTFAILVLIVAGFYFITKAITQYTGYSIKEENSNLEDFAKCLSDKNVKMYAAFWCGHCQNQERLFGEGSLDEGKRLMIDNNIYVECDPRGDNSQSDLCISKGIQGYPTWIINGKQYPGEMSLKRLAELSGCSLD